MTSPNWKQCKCPSAVGGTMNGGGGHLGEYYAATKSISRCCIQHDESKDHNAGGGGEIN